MVEGLQQAVAFCSSSQQSRGLQLAARNARATASASPDGIAVSAQRNCMDAIPSLTSKVRLQRSLALHECVTPNRSGAGCTPINGS